MDVSAFVKTTQRVGAAVSRRRAVKLLGAVAAAVGIAGVDGDGAETEARKRRVRGEHNLRGKKAVMCIGGETRRVPKAKRKKYLKQGATRGACSPACVPVCAAGTCGDDGCGGTCACATGSICVRGTCQVCDVTCAATASPVECGEALSVAVSGGGTVYVCPGYYDYGYTVLGEVSVYGAGDGDDPATSTILRPAAQSRVMEIDAPSTVLLSSLRITGGRSSSSGGGIRLDEGFSNVTLDNCTIAGNEVTDGAGGGGIRVRDDATLLIRGCEISGNTGAGSGGGINSDGFVTITDTLITGNFAGSRGGGVYSDDGTVEMDPTVSITENTAAIEGGGFYEEGGVINPNGAVIVNNIPDQCAGDNPVTC